jgi:hypothetical protein
MKNVIIKICLFTCIVYGFTSCYYEHGNVRGYGNSIEYDVDISYANGVELNGSMDVEIIPSDTFMVVIVAQENIANLMVIETIGDIIKIDYRPRINIIPTDVAKLVLYMPELYSIVLNGSGDIYIHDEYEQDADMEFKINGSGDMKIGTIICDKIETTINGSGDINANFICNELETVVRGSGNIDYKGNAAKHTIRISGSGDVDAFDLLSLSTYINISGSGDTFVWAEEYLEIFISGSGNVTYKGNPQVIIDIPGSGNVISWK